MYEYLNFLEQLLFCENLPQLGHGCGAKTEHFLFV